MKATLSTSLCAGYKLSVLNRLLIVILIFGLYLATVNPTLPLAQAAPATTATRIYGRPSGSFIDSGTNAYSLDSPYGEAVDSTGRLYVIDNRNNRVLSYAPGSTIADRVYGQPDFYSYASATTATGLYSPYAVAVDNTGRLYVADEKNHRVVSYAPFTANGQAADRVYGQPDFTTKTSATTANGLDTPEGVTVDSTGRLYVADENNNRVVSYAPFTANGQAADRVYGQPSFTTKTSAIGAGGLNSPSGVTVAVNGRLYVADSSNNRVLSYAAGSTTADRVYGQPDFYKNRSNYGCGTYPSVCGAGLFSPIGVAVDSTGRLYVADFGNHRVLRYAPYIANYQGANEVYGQPSTTLSIELNDDPKYVIMNYPRGVAVDSSGRLYAADSNNNRVLSYPATSSTADRVYGQGGSFITNSTIGGVSANTLVNPNDVVLDSTGRLYVADTTNNRVLSYAAGSTTADRVYGQPDFTTSPILLGVIPPPVNPSSLYKPSGIAVDSSGRLYIADTGNQRVVSYPVGSTTADRVYGQPNFTTKTSATTATNLFSPSGVAVDSSGRLYVADTNNHRVVSYAPFTANGQAADRVYGQPSFTTKTSATTANGLNFPNGVTVDSTGRLYVADLANHRVVSYAPFTANGQAADRVYGQPNFTTKTSATTANGLDTPEGITLDRTGRLYVADTDNHRVVSYAPFTANGQAADRVYGQPNLTSNTSNNGGISAASLRGPRGVALDSVGNLYVADRSNFRVLFYPDVAPVPPVNLLPTTLRVATTIGGNTPLSGNGGDPKVGDGSSVLITIGGTNGIPANATGIVGILTNVSCNAGGNLRFWAGNTVPASVNLNVPGTSLNIPKAANAFNLSTSFVAPLDTSGKVYLGWSSAAGKTCGYAVDVTGYLTTDSPFKLLPSAVRISTTGGNAGVSSLVGNGGDPKVGDGSSILITVGGTNSIPANATGVFGILTNVSCNAGGNLRFWTGNSVPTSVNLNVPGTSLAIPSATTALNLSTSFVAPLDSTGKVYLGWSSAAGKTCGFAVDVVGYLTNSTQLGLLAGAVRVGVTSGTNANAQLVGNSGDPKAGDNSSFTLTVGGTSGIPSTAQGIIGIVTNISCNSGGNLRFWTGGTTSTSVNLNIPGSSLSIPGVTSALNLSTGFIAQLDSSGKVNLGWSSAAGKTCGYAVDIIGYF